MIANVSSLVGFDCTALKSTDELCTKLVKLTSTISSNEACFRKVHPNREAILDGLKDFRNPNYKVNMRKILGFKEGPEKFNNSSFFKSFNFPGSI